MKSKKVGANTSPIEVSNISRHGLWLLMHDREYFLAFDDFPWFREANLSSILEVQLLHGHHLYWPALDLDLELEAIQFPEKYPLTDKHPRLKATRKSTLAVKPKRAEAPRRGSRKNNLTFYR